MNGDAGALVGCKDVTTAAAAQKGTHGVQAFMVAHITTGGFTLIDVCFVTSTEQEAQKLRVIVFKNILIVNDSKCEWFGLRHIGL